jgi:hypothetical protein
VVFRVGGEVFAFDHPHVGGHLVPALQQHDVAGHEIARGDDLLLSIAQHAAFRHHHPFQRLERLLGFSLLHKADDCVEHHHEQDDDHLAPHLLAGH